MTLTVPCLFGLESLVADEMRRLDLKNVRAENGRVHCEGTLADIARLNINLRCGARVLMELGSFPARDFEALFQGVYALPWEDYIPRDGEFPVKGYSLNSQLHSVPACQSIVKKASAKRLGEKYGVETLPESGSRYQIQFSIIKDVATLYLDTSGEGLYKRGYRAKNMGAPLRETLAAALVTLSRYRGKDPFCDPFCGSGTIPIEAALIAKNRAPGLDRSFAAQKWKNMDSKLWLEAGDEAMDKEFHGHYDIWGGDIDPAAIEYMGAKLGKNLPEMVQFLNKKCGMLGVSGISSDCRDVTAAAENGNERAILTLDMVGYRIKKYVGAFAAVLGGVDAIIFTGGIGEHSPEIRQRVMEGLEYLGVDFDFELNKHPADAHVSVLSKPDSKVKVAIIPTNEELVIARETKELTQNLVK